MAPCSIDLCRKTKDAYRVVASTLHVPDGTTGILTPTPIGDIRAEMILGDSNERTRLLSQMPGEAELHVSDQNILGEDRTVKRVKEFKAGKHTYRAYILGW